MSERNDPRVQRPADPSPEEAMLLGWFARLERAVAPPGLRARVLARASAARLRPAAPTGRLLRFPLGAWGVASAALLLVALGAAVALELADPVVARGPVPPAPVARIAEDIQISEDATLALFHGVEVFDEVGLAPGELIADWGR